MKLEMRTIGFKQMSGSRRVKDVTSRSNLSKLVVKKKWTKIQEAISSNPETLNSSDCEESFFHELCRYDPPLGVIEFIVGMKPDIVNLKNNSEQYSLHLAVQNGASPDVISYLCRLNPKASGLQDNMGKTPLHLASESYETKYTPTGKVKLPVKDASLVTIKILTKASPLTVNLEDLEGMNALEYAIENDVCEGAIRTLQKASEKEWKIRLKFQKKQKEMGGSLRKKLQTCSMST